MIRTKFPEGIKLPNPLERGTLLRSRTGAIIQIRNVRLRRDETIEYDIIHKTKYGPRSGGKMFTHAELVSSGCVLVHSIQKEESNGCEESGE